MIAKVIAIGVGVVILLMLFYFAFVKDDSKKTMVMAWLMVSWGFFVNALF